MTGFRGLARGGLQKCQKPPGIVGDRNRRFDGPRLRVRTERNPYFLRGVSIGVREAPDVVVSAPGAGSVCFSR